MIYEIENREVIINIVDNKEVLPTNLTGNIKEHFKNVCEKCDIWNGDIWCVKDIYIGERIEVSIYKSDYAHYIYAEQIGLDKKYACRSLSAGALIETNDGFYVVGELSKGSSYEKMIQVPGGCFDQCDVILNKLNVEKTIQRELIEEINIDINNYKNIVDKKLKYLYITEDDELPAVQFFAKVKLNVSFSEIEQDFKLYNEELQKNKKEQEFEKLHGINKREHEKFFEKIRNPKRDYLIPLINADIK